MARYYPVSPLYWSDDTVVGWKDSEKLLALYLLTCPHRNLEGLYRLPVAYIEADLGWDRRQVQDAMTTMIVKRFAAYDTKASVVWLPNALKYHQPATKPQVQGALNALQAVPDTPLFEHFAEAAKHYAPRLYEALGEPLTEPLTEGVEEPHE